MPATVAGAIRRLTVLAVASGVVYACASGHSKPGEGGGMPSVNIEVQNDLTIPTVVDAYIYEGGNVRRSLGTVGGGEVKTFKYQPLGYGQTLRLIAMRQLSNPIYSAPFSLGQDLGTVVWSVYTGIVTFRTRDVTETTFVGNKGVIHVPGDSLDTLRVGDSTRDTTRRDSTRK